MSDAPYMPPLNTPRLLLRQLSFQDVPSVYAYAKDPEVARYTTWDPHQSLHDTVAFVEDVLGRYRVKGAADWGIVLKSSNRLVGTCGFAYINEKHKRAEVGYALSRDFWGQGLMTEGVKAVIRYGFDQLQLNRIEARTNVHNVRSSRVMEKCNMQFEGVLRQQMYIKGAYVDLKLYSVLRHDQLSGS